MATKVNKYIYAQTMAHLHGGATLFAKPHWIRKLLWAPTTSTLLREHPAVGQIDALGSLVPGSVCRYYSQGQATR